MFAQNWRAAQQAQKDDPRSQIVSALGLTEFTPAMIETFRQTMAAEGLELDFEPEPPKQTRQAEVVPMAERRRRKRVGAWTSRRSVFEHWRPSTQWHHR